MFYVIYRVYIKGGYGWILSRFTCRDLLINRWPSCKVRGHVQICKWEILFLWLKSKGKFYGNFFLLIGTYFFWRFWSAVWHSGEKIVVSIWSFKCDFHLAISRSFQGYENIIDRFFWRLDGNEVPYGYDSSPLWIW